MLLISSTIKNAFKRVFFLMMLIDLVLVITIMLSYRYNILEMSTDLINNTTSASIYYRDLFESYLKNKYVFLIDDMLLLVKAYDSIDSWRNNSDNNAYFNQFDETYITTNCAIQGTQVEDTSTYTQNWFENNTTIASRLKSTWYNGQNEKTYASLSQADQLKLGNLCVMNNVLGDVLKKHQIWKQYLSTTVNFYTFAFSDSFFVKYPIYYNEYMQSGWVDPSKNQSCNSSSGYDPKCRPNYLESVSSESNIVIVKPYQYASTASFGTDLCIKSKTTDIVDGTSLPHMLGCLSLNFNDIQLYREQLQLSMGTLKKLFIIYEDGSDIDTMFSSDSFLEDLQSYGKLLGLNNNTANNLAEVYIQSMMDSYYAALKATNYTEAKVKALMKDKYTLLNSFYKELLLPKINSMIANYKLRYTSNSLMINSTSMNSFSSSEYIFSLTKPYYYSTIDKTILESDSNASETFYLYPLYISFDYDGDYQLKFAERLQFYMLIVDIKFDKYQNVSVFFSVVGYEIILYFFFLIGINIFIWVIFGMIYYYFSKGFFMPLKEINDLYRNLFIFRPGEGGSIVEKDEISNENVVANNGYNNLFKNPNGINSNSTPSSKSNIIEKKITKWIYAIFKLNEYKEIHDCILTLKILKIIRTFKSVSAKGIKLNYDVIGRENKLENIIDALFYLMHSITSSSIQDLNYDSNLIADLINNNFVYKINSYTEEDEVQSFYEDINNIVEQVLNKKASRRASQLKRLSSIYRSHLASSSSGSNPHFKENEEKENAKCVKDAKDTKDTKDISNPSAENKTASSYQANNLIIENFVLAEKELKIAFTKLKENLQYRYCIFRMNSIESKFYGNENYKDYIDFDFNSDDEDDADMSKPHLNQESDEEIFIKKEEILKRKHKSINRSSERDILALVNEFNRYFSLTDETDISFSFLKHIAAHITQAGLLFEINSDADGIKQCILAMEKMKNLQGKIETCGNLAKFAFISICTLFFERILFLFSTLSEKYDQKKTQFYIYLNILDLGPVYDRKIRANILQKLLDYLNKTGLDYLKKQNRYKSYAELYNENSFVHTKLVRHKVRAILNMSKKFPKNIVLLFDLSLPFLKEPNFQKIIKNNFSKNRHFFYFANFDQSKLHIFRNFEPDEEGLSNADNSSTNYFLNHNFDDQEIINHYKKNDKTDTINDHSENINTEEPDFNHYEQFFKFVENYRKVENVFTKHLKQRVDISIKNAIKFHKFVEYPKNNNFIIVMTTIDAGFSFQRDNLITLSETLYDSHYSLILCILDDQRIYKHEAFRKKLECYKKFIENDIINGQLFILKSFTLFKYVLNCVVPNKFKEFDLSTMKTFLESIDLNFCDSVLEHDSPISSSASESAFISPVKLGGDTIGTFKKEENKIRSEYNIIEEISIGDNEVGNSDYGDDDNNESFSRTSN